jgi:predicted metal-dependent HD superfamily phosphohydrolase
VPLLVDVDLNILGQAPDRFWEYERAIRSEYAWGEQSTYAARRVDILEHFLAWLMLYHTEGCFSRFKAQAQTNLRASIAAAAKWHQGLSMFL